MRVRWAGLFLVLGMFWTATACDPSPSGPGSLLATVDASASLGAVTLEVVGPGVTGFEGVGSTEAYGTVVSSRQNRHRVVLVDPVGGTLRFAIIVQDVRADPPTLTVVAAAGTDNLERITTDVEVLLRMP
ncbi:MAG: hypothetical protein WD995_00760 [Gemmatimonadota bacterium]